MVVIAVLGGLALAWVLSCEARAWAQGAKVSPWWTFAGFAGLAYVWLWFLHQ